MPFKVVRLKKKLWCVIAGCVTQGRACPNASGCVNMTNENNNTNDQDPIDHWEMKEISKMSEQKGNSLDVQVGGQHYKQFPIQPIEFTVKNGLGFCEGNIIKYVARHKHKNGKQDLLKAKHYIDLLIDLEYPKDVMDE